MEHMIKNQNITYYAKNIDVPEQCILVCDVGGTNTRCAIIEVNGTVQTVVFALRVLTCDVVAFTDVIMQALAIAREKYNIVVKKAVCAVAGCPVKHMDVWRLANVAWAVGKKEIVQKTTITEVALLNDFEAIGYSLEILSEKDLVCLNQGTANICENKAVLGAGTGIGKCIVAWDSLSKHYVPVPSEGGHADFPLYNQEELLLVAFLQKKLKSNGPIRYGKILSGWGISNIYQFLEQSDAYTLSEYSHTINAHDYDPATIASYKNVDARSKKTFELFSAFYGRCAKNFTLEARAFGGVYLAGGIAAKNTEIFGNGIFMSEFLNNSNFKDLLAQTPIFIIINQDAGLYGAAHFAALHFT